MVVPSVVQPGSLSTDYNTSPPNVSQPQRLPMERFESSSRVRQAQRRHDERLPELGAAIFAKPATTPGVEAVENPFQQVVRAMSYMKQDGNNSTIPEGSYNSASDTEVDNGSTGSSELTRTNSPVKLSEAEEREVRKVAIATQGADQAETDKWVRAVAMRRAGTSEDIHDALRKEQAARAPQPTRMRSQTEGDFARRSSGEWVSPVHAAPVAKMEEGMQEADMQEHEGRVVIPSFYRKPTVDQTELVHRLAVLSVNNFSGDPGLGEEDVGEAPVARDRELAKQALRQNATENDIEEMAQDIKIQRIERKKTELEYALKHDDEDELKEKLAPASFLSGESGIEGKSHPDGGEAQERQKQTLVSAEAHGTKNHDFAGEGSGERVKVPTQDEDDEAEDDEVIEQERKRRATVTGQQKIDAIQEEFGELASLMEGNEQETFVGECKGALFRGIMIIVRQCDSRWVTTNLKLT